MAQNHGGKRQGAGRKPGSKSRATQKAKATFAELAQNLSVEALNTLEEIMRDTQSPAAARVAAANSIIDRGYGKPRLVEDAADVDEAQTLNITFNTAAPVGDVRVTRSDD